MKYVTLAACAALSLAAATTTVFAADAGRSRPTSIAYVAPPAWAGSYIGINLGHMSRKATADATFLGVPAGSASETKSAWGVNGYYGYNWQNGNFVFGPELSLGTAKDMPIVAEGRFRAGYSFGSVLPYLAAGVTAARVKIDTPIQSWSETRVGWNIGGGADIKLAGNWSARLEYVYTDLGTKHHDIGALGLDVGLSGHIVRGGLNYRF